MVVTATVKSFLGRMILPAALTLLRVYWFLFRPHEYSAKVMLLHEEQLLLIKHTYGRENWSLPGGGSKSNEAPEETAAREVLEELSITLTTSELIPLGSLVSRKAYKYDHVSMYVAKVNNKGVNPDPFEIKEVRWFALDALPINLSDTATSALNHYEQNKFK